MRMIMIMRSMQVTLCAHAHKHAHVFIVHVRSHTCVCTCSGTHAHAEVMLRMHSVVCARDCDCAAGIVVCVHVAACVSYGRYVCTCTGAHVCARARYCCVDEYLDVLLQNSSVIARYCCVTAALLPHYGRVTATLPHCNAAFLRYCVCVHPSLGTNVHTCIHARTSVTAQTTLMHTRAHAQLYAQLHTHVLA